MWRGEPKQIVAFASWQINYLGDVRHSVNNCVSEDAPHCIWPRTMARRYRVFWKWNGFIFCCLAADAEIEEERLRCSFSRGLTVTLYQLLSGITPTI